MILAKELRLRNLVYNPNKSKVIEVMLLDATYDKTQWHPIPLTEEWLLKFGFKKKFKKSEYFEFEDWIKIELEDNNKDEPIWDFRCKNTYLTDMEFVHQLQNLFYALTGEELNIKEDSITINVTGLKPNTEYDVEVIVSDNGT